jgi:hypothetical protein
MRKLILSSVLITILSIFIYQSVNAQAQRRVLFEQWTSSTCGPCASNNPYLHPWMVQNTDSVVGIAYHVGWPSPGNDPMYLHNPTESYDRRFYYGVNAVPWLQVDGLYHACLPFSNNECFAFYYRYQLAIPTPVVISITDTRTADSVRTTVKVTNLSNLPAGTYYLRVMAVEKKIIYPSPPGTNGEAQFPQVFRKSVPNSTGIALPTAAGTYTYNLAYAKNSAWIDEEIYTTAFVQNDATKEILNAARNGDITTGITQTTSEVPVNYSISQNYPNPFNPATKINFALPKDGPVSLKVYNALGKEVATLVDTRLTAGTYTFNFNGTGLASGIYFYKINSGSFNETKKMILSK